MSSSRDTCDPSPARTNDAARTLAYSRFYRRGRMQSTLWHPVDWSVGCRAILLVVVPCVPWPSLSRFRRPDLTTSRSTRRSTICSRCRDRIAATPETIPVPDWHREIIEERLKDLDANPNAGESWEVVQERLRKKFDSRQ